MIRDLVLGLRLAVGGGRMSGQALLRLVMTTIGVALVVAILLPAASVGNVVSEYDAREAANAEVTDPRPGVDPLHSYGWYTELDDDYLVTHVVAASGPNSPVPPGLDRIPAPGELFVSPAVAELLAGPKGDSVRARVPGTVAGEIGKAGLDDAGDLKLYLGTTVERLSQTEGTELVTGFGVPPDGFMLDATTALLMAPIVVALLLPLLIFVTTASRMGAAQRERRLAALRLLGVDARQVRRIAAAESLLGALAGLVVGTALFLALRPLIGQLDLFGLKLFPEDFVPPWQLAVLIALLVPGLAVGTAIFGLRRTIVEPLGVVRQSKPIKRRMWWRWGITGLGALLMGLTLLAEERDNGDAVGIALSVGSALLLIGVAALLPWAVEKVVRGLRGGTPSLQFAVRRLQMDGGTASRVVSGLVVVLAGTILIQTLMVSLTADDAKRTGWQPPQALAAEIVTDGGHADEVRQRLAGVPGLTGVHEVASATLRPPGAKSGRDSTGVEIGDCAALRTMANLPSCADGDVFAVGVPEGSSQPWTGPPTGELQFYGYQNGEPRPGPMWTVPAQVRTVPGAEAAQMVTGNLLVTPGALGSVRPDGSITFTVSGPGEPNAVIDRAAAALSPLGWDVHVRAVQQPGVVSAQLDERTGTFRAALLAASAFVLSVAALSLLMLSIEQIVERRRPLAALSASGVPLSVLARGSLWQNAIPVLVGVVLAIAAGLGLTVPTLRYVGLPFTLDVGLLLTMGGAAVLAVLVTTALTWPLLRQVTRLDGLRAE
ncbi:FtsX-like permease family protein [Amycolatopsis sp. 195334CR]|uniref:FtsX-like permease family protein n=1 Tax=Amycolatopsis sp. 195334CR TaxID=2814588 RepID=UPI001A8C19BA|nr:FtsX-like permease family protein [Amycolatopsis sp. 195334CR]MBN6041773.1 ABC transporter permease [Amycolatopsis sp. 195334CR]